MERQRVAMTPEAVQCAATAVRDKDRTTARVEAAALSFQDWLAADLAYPTGVSAVEAWAVYDGLGAGTVLVAAAVDRLRGCCETAWMREDFTAAVAFLERFARTGGSPHLDGTRRSVEKWLFGQGRLLEEMSAALWVLIEEAATCRFRYENLRREVDQVPDASFGLGAPAGVVLPAADAVAGAGGLGDIVAALGATRNLVSAMADAFRKMAREGFAEKSDTLAYVDAMTAPAPDPDDPDWMSPKRMARKMKDLTNALEFGGEGCAMVNTAVIETLKGRPTVPTRRPAPDERWPARGAARLYGDEGETLYGMRALTAYLDEQAQQVGDLFHVEMVSRDSPIGHAVTVVRTHRGLLYIDVGLGGGRRKASGRLEKAQWGDYGFDTFTVTAAGNARLDAALDSDPET
ncbi:hypothetical protein LG634_07310 [Streptomyces bambusae]|uniref:hypothetical protein n=1 Tax=Streptomyces bambusae TaxID=1550616 RepID=UPI001CFC8DD2|nr:hypothetical protein [Streptomyces bambusae]MCB5164640.1 hypothetical protein [Streptomyces bambusae]